MRNCPACDCPDKAHFYPHEVHPLFECANCGMRYLDSDAMNQESLNAYYLSGDTSPDLHDEDTHVRLRALADRIATYAGIVRSVDVGGMYSELKGMVPGMEAIGAGQHLEGFYDLVIISHCLEHVYDINGLMGEIVEHLNRPGRLLIEVPIFYNYDDPTYDNNWYHVNKFRAEDLFTLLQRFKFGFIYGIAVPDFKQWHCYRVEAQR